MPGHEDQLRRVAAALDEARRRRDVAIVQASEAGLPRRRVAESVGLSDRRVQQILNGARKGK